MCSLSHFFPICLSSADPRIYATVVVRRALAALDNNYRAYLWQLVTKDVADSQSPLHFILALGNTMTVRYINTCE